MRIYRVGGAVRDRMLNLPVQDRDFVVVGATPKDMLAEGFKPVGRDFPVFLHPTSHEEYALARTERKTAPGYQGFAFHADPAVTLEEDLARRDLTINAMAEDEEGVITDPFGGRADLAARVLRHVGPAFVEDPVRLLRVARFAARFTDFSVAPETLDLMRVMVEAGEVDALVPERIWQEIARGLMEAAPSRMFRILEACGALGRIAPELADATDLEWTALDRSAARRRPLPVRSAIWLAEAGLEVTRVVHISQRLRLPSACSELAVLTVRERASSRALVGGGASAVLEVLERTDALRRADRFAMLLQAWEDLEGEAFEPIAAGWLRALGRIQSVDAGAIAQRVLSPPDIARAVRQARLDALESAGL